MVHFYSSQVDGNPCSTAHIFRRRKPMLYCSCFQEKETHALLLMFSGEGNPCSTAHVFRRRGLVLNCSRNKGVRAVKYFKERKWCCTISDESRQLVIVKFGKKSAVAFGKKLSVLSR